MLDPAFVAVVDPRHMTDDDLDAAIDWAQAVRDALRAAPEHAQDAPWRQWATAVTVGALTLLGSEARTRVAAFTEAGVEQLEALANGDDTEDDR